MKRFGSICCLLLALCWADLSYGYSPDKHVVFINPGKQGEAFWELVTKTMQAAATQFGFRLEVLWSERNKSTMQAIGVAAARRVVKPDFMIIVNEENAAAPILRAADMAGIPTLFLSNPMSDEDIRALSAIGPPVAHLIGSLEPDLAGAGYRMAERLIQAARADNRFSRDGKLHILALAGDHLTPNSIARTNGFLSYTQHHPDVVVDRLLYSNWNRADAAKLSHRYFAWARGQNLTPAGIWAANDPIAIGAIDAIEQNGLTAGKDVVVVGLNWSSEGIELIKADKLLLSDGGHFFGGAWSMVILRDVLSGCRPRENAGAATGRVVFALSAIEKSTDEELISILSEHAFTKINYNSFLTHNANCGNYDFSTKAILRAVTHGTAAK